MLLSSFSSLSSCDILSSEGFDANAKIRAAWIRPDDKSVLYTNEADKLKSLEQFSMLDEVKEKAKGIRWNKYEKMLHQEDDIVYAAEKMGYMWIMCVFNNVTIETNKKVHWHKFEKKLLMVDVVKSLCDKVEHVTYDIVVRRHSKLYETWDDFENDLAIPLEFPN